MALVSSQKGQMTVEAVLILTMIVGLTSFASQYIRQKGWAESMVKGPWELVGGMIESGVWTQRKDARAFHPNKNVNRRLSIKGERENVN